MSFPSSPLPGVINCEEQHVAILRTLVNDFLSELFLFSFGAGVGWDGVETFSQKPSVPLSLNFESAVTDTIAKEAAVPITAGSSLDY